MFRILTKYVTNKITDPFNHLMKSTKFNIFVKYMSQSRHLSQNIYATIGELWNFLFRNIKVWSALLRLVIMHKHRKHALLK